jgi:hypothetical protein
MRLHRLNDSGMQKMTEFLGSLTSEAPLAYPEYLLTENGYAEVIDPAVEIHKKQFTDRLSAGKYLSEIFEAGDLQNAVGDRGVWAWLSLFFFDQLCRTDSKGRPAPGELARWIPAMGNFRKYYRHLLAGPFRIYRAHRDDPNRARALLCTPVSSPGDVAEQLASRQELVTNRSIMGAATRLYVDPKTGHAKRGSAGRGPGSARRLADIFNQLDITWDLYYMNTDSVLGLLPEEFSKFSMLPK